MNDLLTGVFVFIGVMYFLVTGVLGNFFLPTPWDYLDVPVNPSFWYVFARMIWGFVGLNLAVAVVVGVVWFVGHLINLL